MNTENQHGATREKPLLAGFLFITLTLAGGCAHVTESVSYSDVPVRTFKKTTEPAKPDTYYTACKSLSDFEYECGLDVESTCRVTSVDVVDRTEERKRTTSTASKVVEWLAASTLLGAGVGVTADAPNVYGSNDSRGTNPVGKAGAYGIGISLTALGAGVLALAITDSARAIDRRKHLGEVEIAGLSTRVACARRPAAGIQISGECHGKLIELGVASEDGRMRFDVSQLVPAELVADADLSPSISLFVDKQHLSDIPLDKYRKHVFQTRLSQALASGDYADWMRFFYDFPGAYKVLGDSEDLKALSSKTLMEIEALCRNTSDLSKIGDCEDSVEKVILANPDDRASALRASLASRRIGIEEKTRIEEERLAQLQQARLEAWSRSHIPAAKKAARSYVLNNLKVPSTARILSTKVLQAEGASYVVHLIVDAQNSFGVFIRTGYCVSIELLMNEFGRYVPNGIEECGLDPDY